MLIFALSSIGMRIQVERRDEYMSRQSAWLVFSLLVVLLVLGIMDAFVNPARHLIPDRIVSLAAVIVAGVAVGLILAALRASNGTSHTDDD